MSSKEALAAEAWKRLFHFFIGTRRQRDEVLGHYELTPNDIRALTSLSAEEGRTMRSLAEEWGCDASNATWIVDRIEKRGLAARTAHEHDRRIKRVVLTALGEKTRRSVLRDLDRPPPEFLALEVKQLVAIRDALKGVPRGDRRIVDMSHSRRSRPSPARARRSRRP